MRVAQPTKRPKRKDGGPRNALTSSQQASAAEDGTSKHAEKDHWARRTFPHAKTPQSRESSDKVPQSKAHPSIEAALWNFT